MGQNTELTLDPGDSLTVTDAHGCLLLEAVYTGSPDSNNARLSVKTFADGRPVASLGIHYLGCGEREAARHE